jgi:thymidylate synthase ThyX
MSRCTIRYLYLGLGLTTPKPKETIAKLWSDKRMQPTNDEFSENQIKILSRYVTNTSSNIFVLRNLPEVIKGALFSRYSRSSLGLRSLLLKEFILNEETAFSAIAGFSHPSKEEEDHLEIEDQIIAIKKAQNFYDRILDGYGDDSIGELGGAHLAVENVSMIAAKVIEDCRIGGSPLEKSTRYIYFDQKVGGEYLFYREPVLMTSAYRDLYVETCNHLFDMYSKLIPPLTELMEKRFPRENDISAVAYTAALRAKVLDCLRGLLPASALTNMGVYGNGRFFEALIQKLNCHNLAELQEVGKKSYQELSKVIPSFIRRGDLTHKHQKAFTQFTEQMQSEIKAMAHQHASSLSKMRGPSVRLLSYDPSSPEKVAAAILFPFSNAGLLELQDYCARLPEEELGRVLDSGCNARENRRHKSPRALEQAAFTFEIVADFGVYRDLQRHRMLTQDRQLLSCELGYYVPSEIKGTEMEKEYCDAMEEAKRAFERISGELPEEAQYVVPMAYNIHWYFHVNLRTLQWMCELRSAPAGHPTYRHLAQEMAKQVCQVLPQFERYFKFVDFDGYELGRLGQEIRTVEKREAYGR